MIALVLLGIVASLAAPIDRRQHEKLMRDVFNNKINDLATIYPSNASEVNAERNIYVVAVPLDLFEFKQEDIAVTAKKGVWKLEAKRDGEEFTQVSALPDNVEPQGSWAFSNETLTVVFNKNGEDAKQNLPEDLMLIVQCGK